ncbi:ABC transporter permease [Cytophagaceae bacterium DM2B3-1]|uniref:ABC transporter permease n=1 Tax=Xanthocytophaga flava TaxID=3048013 RepID=A0ABT7CL85_9BACT|nr:ABC transporter permease [Xanthocytophaga flavus]MDJ1494301.1 ABC transporter permease [Xanthocytophaga flavus]
MFHNYLIIVLRNIKRNQIFSFINIIGLAVGMAVAILIGLWMYDEFTFDQYHSNYDRIAQVMQHQTLNGNKGTQNAIPRPLEMALRNSYNNYFTHLSMATWTGGHILAYKDQKISKSGNYMQPSITEMLSLQMIQGKRNGLQDPSSILLSQSTAKALFGDIDPLGKTIKIDNKDFVKVAGVYKDLPYNTTFRDLEFIAPWNLFVRSQEWVQRAADRWGNNSFQLFVQLSPSADIQAVSEKIKKVKAQAAPDEVPFKPEIFLYPMKDWHLRSNWKDGRNAGGRIQIVWMFGVIGVFVLLLACINFMNLSTARSEKRAKEVGIRKSIGSERRQLIGQFLGESLLITGFSFFLALVLVQLSLPLFNEISDKKISILWTNPLFWLFGIGFSVLTGLIAGSYPALYLSSFDPVSVLKGTFRAGGKASLPRKILVVVQFTVSVSLIIGTIIVYRQIQYSKDRPIGYNRDGLVMVTMSTPDFQGKFSVLQRDLKKSGAILEMAESSSPLTSVWSNNGGFSWKGKHPDLQTDFATIWVSPEFGQTVGWNFTQGRDFSKEFLTDSTGIVINEAAVKFMGVKDPVGMEVDWSGEVKLHVVGVIKDMLMQSPYRPVKPTIYLMNKLDANWFILKLNPAYSASQSLKQIQTVFTKHIPQVPFEYKFADAEYATKFNDEERLGKLATFFATLAIFISCLGIFGLASFTAEQRRKEIGIRKVLGASILNLWQLLSKEFIVLVLTSFVIATPISWYFLQGWLQSYTYRIEISWWIFAVAGLGALIITLATVSYQAIKAAIANPTKSLRTE